MPMYPWKCTKCSAGVDTLRPATEYNDPPKGDELPPVTDPPCEHEWKRVIGRTSFKLQGYGWARDGYE